MDTTLEALPYSIARWVVGGWDRVSAAGRLFNTAVVKDRWGRPVLLFRWAGRRPGCDGGGGGSFGWRVGAINPGWVGW